MADTGPRIGIADKRRAFRRLHDSGLFVIPNPWDPGSARMLQGLGFKALASTSSGFAWSRGHPDNRITLEMSLAHLRELVDATDVPINADFENGFAHDPAGVALNVRKAADTGVAGISIEDATGDAARPLYAAADAAERVRAARRAIDESGADVMLVGRAEGFLHPAPNLDDVLSRLRAYADAGADCLYAPGLRTREQVAAVVAAVAPRPVNVLVSAPGGFTVAELESLGVRRISVGGGLARAAWAGFLRAARTLAQQGSFDGFAGAASGQELDGFFAADLDRRHTP